jgi:hypothetical protein
VSRGRAFAARSGRFDAVPQPPVIGVGDQAETAFAGEGFDDGGVRDHAGSLHARGCSAVTAGLRSACSGRHARVPAAARHGVMSSAG